MATLVNTKIIVNTAVKNKVFGYFITVDKKNVNYLTIKAVDYIGRNKGIAGKISRNGSVDIISKHREKLKPMINSTTMQTKIEMMLDMVYGKDRTEFTKIVKAGLTKFNRRVSIITKPVNYSHLGGR